MLSKTRIFNYHNIYFHSRSSTFIYYQSLLFAGILSFTHGDKSRWMNVAPGKWRFYSHVLIHYSYSCTIIFVVWILLWRNGPWQLVEGPNLVWWFILQGKILEAKYKIIYIYTSQQIWHTLRKVIQVDYDHMDRSKNLNSGHPFPFFFIFGPHLPLPDFLAKMWITNKT